MNDNVLQSYEFSEDASTTDISVNECNNRLKYEINLAGKDKFIENIGEYGRDNVLFKFEVS